MIDVLIFDIIRWGLIALIGLFFIYVLRRIAYKIGVPKDRERYVKRSFSAVTSVYIVLICFGLYTSLRSDVPRISVQPPPQVSENPYDGSGDIEKVYQGPGDTASELDDMIEEVKD